jgi:hypothetical protein
MQAKSHCWHVCEVVEGLLRPDSAWPNIAIHCGELFRCQEGFLDHGERLLLLVANDDIKWDRSHCDEFGVQNMHLCPCISQWRGWPWDMVFYIFPDIYTSHEALHIQWPWWAWLPFWWNGLSLTSSHLLGMQQQPANYLLVSHHHLDWVNHALDQPQIHHLQEFPSQWHPLDYLQRIHRLHFGKSVTDIL